MPAGAFSGLHTKARFNATASACIEHTCAEDGTVQALAELVAGANEGQTVYTYDLNTGSRLGRIGKDSPNIGTYIFWACLGKCMEMDAEERSAAFLTMIKEPGKARTVTKTSAYVKVVLDVVSKICSHPLSKVQSSRSGMKQDAHGWNFFRAMFTNAQKGLFFDVKSKEVESVTVDGRTIVERYRPIGIQFKDLENATDYTPHEVGDMLGTYWMERCGIPGVLIDFVRSISYTRRKIYFEGWGPAFKDFGLSDENGRYILSSKGILMGDPMTKPVLHLNNAVNRKIASLSENPECLTKTFSNGMSMQKVFSDALTR